MANANIILTTADGPTLTAAARATCLLPAQRIPFPANFWYPGRGLRVRVGGRLSCVVTTPGTARWDICLGAAGTTIVFDSGALNLNVVAKTTVPFLLDVVLACRTIGSGTSATFFPLYGRLESEAVVGSAAAAAGGNGSLLCPVGTPAAGAGFDSTVANIFDLFFTQTVATGSMTIHTLQLDLISGLASAGYNFE
jgi:hypothetical protein